jgi:LIVCS family branched-chain amino acid:cation transporter
MAANGEFENGTQMLASAAALLFGQSGPVLLGIIFTLACFTTVVGLTSACGQYFSELLPKATYKLVVLMVSLIGFILSNMGLSQILKVSVPFLVTAYPLTIVLVSLTFFDRYFKGTRMVYGSTMLFTGIFSIISGLNAFGLSLGPVDALRTALPFSSVGLEWVVPAIIGTLIGILLSKFMPAAESEKLKAKAS